MAHFSFLFICFISLALNPLLGGELDWELELQRRSFLRDLQSPQKQKKQEDQLTWQQTAPLRSIEATDPDQLIKELEKRYPPTLQHLWWQGIDQEEAYLPPHKSRFRSR